MASSEAFYAADASEPVTDWQDYSNYYDEYDDDEEVEDFYFSSAAGRARIVLGNRRWGENGYVASGRQQGRPVQRAPKATPNSSAKKGSASKAAAVNKDDKAAEKSSSATKTAAATNPAVAVITSACQGSNASGCNITASSSNAGGALSTSHSTASPIAMPSTPVAIQGNSRGSGSAGRRSSGFDVAGTSSDSLWGSSNSGGGWSAYERGKKAAGRQQGLMGSSPSNEGSNSKAGRRARRNAKKAAADAKADVYAY